MFAFENFELDFRGHIHIYVQIVERVKHLIACSMMPV